MSEENYEWWYKERENAGLKGKELLDWVDLKEKVAYERAERAATRELEKEKLSTEKEKLLTERVDKEKQLETLRQQGGGSGSSRPVSVSLDTTKPVPYKDGEDITAYIIRFERIASMLGWNTDSWAVKLGSLLQGKALDVFSSLGVSVTSDYESLKENLLKGFKCTTEQYRQEFRSARIGSHLNYSQFLIFLFRQFDFWINSTSISKDYKSLCDFIVGDQFLSTLPVDLRLFVKERKPARAEEMAELADTYASARKQFHNVGSKESEGKGVNKKSECKDSKVSSSEQKESSKQSNRLCYKCGESGHLIARCPLRNNAGKQNAKVDLVVSYSGREGPISSGKVNGVSVGKILRDTGCTSFRV